MSYTFSFADNGVYSAADVNKITSRLVTSGVADPFTDGVPYNLSALNDAGTLLYTDGVVPETVNTLKVTKAEEEGTIFIYPGTAFFSDGSVIEIEAGGETLSYTAGAVNYVYLKNDLINTNTSYPVCTTEAPEGSYVMLAEISEAGEITDKRTYARGKLPGYASRVDNVLEIHDTVTGYTLGTNFTETKTYDIGNNKYRFMLVYDREYVSANGTALGIYDFAKSSYLSFDFVGNVTTGYVQPYTDKLILYREADRARIEATVSVSNGILTLTINGWPTIDSFSYTIYLF